VPFDRVAHCRKIARLGGIGRAKSLSAQERSEGCRTAVLAKYAKMSAAQRSKVARKASLARWKKAKPAA